MLIVYMRIVKFFKTSNIPQNKANKGKYEFSYMGHRKLKC